MNKKDKRTDPAINNFLLHTFANATMSGEGAEEASNVARHLNDDIPKKQHHQLTVWDSTGNPLIKGGMYKFRDMTVSILREQYGCGNIADTYYYVYYMKPDNTEGCVCIEQNGGSIFGGWTYTSGFEPLQPKA